MMAGLVEITVSTLRVPHMRLECIHNADITTTLTKIPVGFLVVAISTAAESKPTSSAASCVGNFFGTRSKHIHRRKR